jgi:hypothetical protein
MDGMDADEQPDFEEAGLGRMGWMGWDEVRRF